jgi:hypothetical protein
MFFLLDFFYGIFRNSDDLKERYDIFTINFKKNVTLCTKVRKLGQSWYAQERGTFFGIALSKKETDRGLSKWHFTWCLI